jgi:hypothetical protein
MIANTVIFSLALTALSFLFTLSRSDGQQTENGYDHMPEEAIGVEVSYPNAPHEAEELVWI